MTCLPLRRSRVLLLLALAVVALVGRPAAAGGDPFDSLASTFRGELASEKGDTRLHAFHMVGESRDPRAVDLAIEGTNKESQRRDALAKTQEGVEAELEKVLAAIEKENAKSPPSTPREIDAYNKRMKKLEDQRDAQNARLADLAVDAIQQRAILAAATRTVGKVLASLSGPDAEAAVERTKAAWKGPKSTPEDRVRWVEAVVPLRSAAVTGDLHALAADEAEDPRVRVAALEACFSRGDVALLDTAAPLLASTCFPVRAEAIDLLRRLHVKGAIEPLIEVLGREDLGEARSRVHAALKSLTGQKNGPYQQPWRDWWREAKATFVMPDKPADAMDLATPEKGLTFYGITTFSDKVLFVLDVSGSMLDPAHPDAGGARGEERKIDVLRKELSGAIDMLDEGKRFNLLLFSHRVIRYQAGALPGDRPTREAAKKFATGVEPSGGTNIHDALETAFRLANASADGKTYQPIFDTIYFLTDGTPTAGKLRKPEDILASVEEWNRNALVTVHCIGVGASCDEKFLKSLAVRNHGSFVKR